MIFPVDRIFTKMLLKAKKANRKRKRHFTGVNRKKFFFSKQVVRDKAPTEFNNRVFSINQKYTISYTRFT